MPSFGIINTLQQAFPSKPAFTEENVGDLSGKVYIVTGASSGVGQELARILYSCDARVYIAARSKDRAFQAMEAIRQDAAGSEGELIYLHLDLADLSTIKRSAEDFLVKESRLDVLFNNAGVMDPPWGAKTAQGYELQLGVNNIGTFMLTKLLTPILSSTAAKLPPGSGAVRVVWVSSSASDLLSPPGGVPVDTLDSYGSGSSSYLPGFVKYGVSKAGNFLQSTEYARRHTARHGIVSVAVNPGNLDSELYRSQLWPVRLFLRTFILYPSVYGAYTELYAGLSPELTPEKSGSWIAPWGRIAEIRQDLVVSSKVEAEGGTGVADRFWLWMERQIEPYC